MLLVRLAFTVSRETPTSDIEVLIFACDEASLAVFCERADSNAALPCFNRLFSSISEFIFSFISSISSWKQPLNKKDKDKIEIKIRILDDLGIKPFI